MKFYGKNQEASTEIDGVEAHDEERIVASSYFKYKQYPFLYKFFESYEYHKLEKQFHSMLQVDISKCFPSIYTHSIGWAVKGKRLVKSKRFKSGSFDVDFDNLMQTINYRETNGIIVGPEVSRIFAEVILQKIDLNLIKRMEASNHKISIHYDFRRYVDDYFFFFCSNEVKQTFLEQLELCLLDYKMYLNNAKTSIASRPFVTSISIAKHTLSKTIYNSFSTRYIKNEDGKTLISHLKNPQYISNKMIIEIKMALAGNKVEYHSISNYIFGAIAKRVYSYLSIIHNIEKTDERYINWILVDLDVTFFVHAMDIRVRPTDRLARLISKLLEKTHNWSEQDKNILHKKIFDHIRRSIDTLIDSLNSSIGLEGLNLLTILTMLPPSFNLPESKVITLFEKIKGNSQSYDFYFCWVTFMLYIRDSQNYNTIRLELLKDAEVFLHTDQDMFISTEYFLFYFDYLACPYISESTRKEMFDSVKKITLKADQPVKFDSDKHGKILLTKDFLVNWRDPSYLKHSLEKRQYVFSYG
jgi:hypothetical protein